MLFLRLPSVASVPVIDLSDSSVIFKVFQLSEQSTKSADALLFLDEKKLPTIISPWASTSSLGADLDNEVTVHPLSKTSSKDEFSGYKLVT